MKMMWNMKTDGFVVVMTFSAKLSSQITFEVK